MGRKKIKDVKTDLCQKSISKDKILEQLMERLHRLSFAPPQSSINKQFELHNEIVEVLTEIQLLQKNDFNSSRNDRSDGATISNFTKWLKENGAQFDDIEIAHFPGYDWGLKAQIDLNESTLIMSIPRKLFLTSDAANDVSLANFIQKDSLLHRKANVALALVLLFEKFKKDSFWKPYIDILPDSHSTVLYFTLEELEVLKGTSVLKDALCQIQNICWLYAYLYKLILTSDNPTCKILKRNFTFDQFRWATSTIMTRQNTVPSKYGKSMIGALIPLWDLCNHTNGTITTDYNPDLERCDCFALKNFAKNDQIFIFYGVRNNADFFLHNGFVYEDNEFDTYLLKLGISKNDLLIKKRTKLLESLSISKFEFFIRKGSEPIDMELLTFLRVFNMKEDDLNYWMEKEQKNDLKIRNCDLNKELEQKCWNFLQTRLKLLLSAYDTSIDESQLLSSCEITENKKLGLRLKKIEKELLRNALAYVERQL